MIPADPQIAVPTSARSRHRQSRKAMTPLLCFSHLRWGFVWQRPQHLLGRMAHRRPVIFVEEPVFHGHAAPPFLDIAEHGNVVVLTPSLPRRSDSVDGFGPRNNALIKTLLSRYCASDLFQAGATVWYYTPMAMGALPSNMAADVVVFDAMDELANFSGAPKELRDREAMLLRSADLVFAGGPSLYEQRKPYHPMTFDFPSGVDAGHFRPSGRSCPVDLAAIPGPIIGFYGVIDERIDLELLESVASMRPEWSIVLIGPVVKIDESTLPQRDNIHYLGMRTYAELPAYLEHFDAAILPFAINDATRFISPTKTLEYLAGDKPVVSTPIHDVVTLYGGVVNIASTPSAFVEAIELDWSMSGTERTARGVLVKEVLAKHSWDVISTSMERLIEAAQERRMETPWIGRRSPLDQNPMYPSLSNMHVSELGD